MNPGAGRPKPNTRGHMGFNPPFSVSNKRKSYRLGRETRSNQSNPIHAGMGDLQSTPPPLMKWRGRRRDGGEGGYELRERGIGTFRFDSSGLAGRAHDGGLRRRRGEGGGGEGGAGAQAALQIAGEGERRGESRGDWSETGEEVGVNVVFVIANLSIFLKKIHDMKRSNL